MDQSADTISFASSVETVSEQTGASYYQLATASTANATSLAAISNALKFATSKSIRTSTIILASFNALAAFTTAAGIIYGSYTYRKRMQRKSSDPPSGLFFIPTIEIFPLVLSLAITIQSIIFAGAQSVGLQALLSRGCTIVAVFTLPALFMVPFVHFIFGLETAIRGFRSQFAPRGKWTVGVCVGIAIIMTIVTFIVAAVDKAPDFCFASLFWYLKVYSPICFAVLLIVTIVLLISIVTIFLKLSRGRNMIDPIERLASSRMVYYLCVGVISNAFIIPFFFSLTFFDLKKVILQALDLAMVASVVANVNGLMVAGLHLFLRSQNQSAFGPTPCDYDRKPYDWDNRDRGSSHSLQQVNTSNSSSRTRGDSVASLLHPADVEPRDMISSSTYSASAARNAISPKLYIPADPKYPEPTQPPSETSPSQMRKQSYSVFPQGSSTATTLLPATTYSPISTNAIRDTWKPPPIVKPWAGRGHRRDSSIVSTATVQIGIRISNVEDFLPYKKKDTTRDHVPDVKNAPMVPQTPVAQPWPLATASVAPEESQYASEYEEEEEADIILSEPPKRQSDKDLMKNLPPVPNSPTVPVNKVMDGAEKEEKQAEEQLVTLSPAVYTPPQSLHRSASQRQKLPSPLGVGFSLPPRQSGSTATSPMPTSKADWI